MTPNDAPPTSSAKGRSWGVPELLIVALITVTLAGAGYLFLNSGGGILATGPGPTLSPVIVDLPASGQIWFGTSFDVDTFAIKAKTFRVNTNTPFSMVATLTHSVDGADMSLRLSRDGGLAVSQPLDVTGFGDVWGFTPDPLLRVGTWRYDLVDIGGDVLATGTIQAA